MSAKFFAVTRAVAVLGAATAIAAAGLPHSVSAQAARGATLGSSSSERAPTSLERLTTAPALDGVLDEPAWRGVPEHDLVTYEPAYGAPPSERSTVRFAHDDRFLYVAGALHDRDPAGVRGNSLQRDQWSGDDRFGVLVDPFDDNQTGLWFWTTPEGVRGDALVTDDGGSLNDHWNTHWDVAVHRADGGWFVEMRIPLSSLGFQRMGDVVTMGVVAERYIARLNERHVYPDISPDLSWRRPSLGRDVELRDVVADRPVYVTPFVLAGRRREARLPAGASAFDFESRTPTEVGADLRVPITHNLTLDLTTNTDFAQVEVDDQQINLTRFSLFFPEKRQFFLERAGIFAFGTGGGDRLFHSRTIGLDSDGLPVRILGGVRLAGRVGEWDIGFLDMQTDASGPLSSENFGVARLSRRVLNEYSTAGGILTSRIGADGTHNVALGADTRLRMRGDDYLAAAWAHTWDDAVGGALGDASLVRVQAWRARQDGFVYAFSGRYSGPAFRPELGFQRRTDFTELTYWVSWAKILGEGNALRRLDPFQLFGNVVRRNGDGSVESAFVEYDTDFTWKSGWGIWQDFEVYYDDLRRPLDFPEASTVPAGSYTYFRTEGGLNLPPGGLFRGGLSYGVQRFFDGSLWNVGTGSTWSLSRHLSLGANYNLNVVRFPERGQGFDAHLVRLRVQTALDTRLSVSAFLQYSSVADLAAANLRLRYNFSEGTDLWIVYDEGLTLDREGLVPRPPLSARRTLLVKYSRTLRW